MRKIFGLITIYSILVSPVLAATPANFGILGNHPSPTANIKVWEKVGLSDIIGEPQGPPVTPPGQGGTPPGKDKDKEGGTASGVLGDYPVKGSKYAIIIGICDYPAGEENYDLCKSDGDSLHIYKALTTLYGYDPANIRLFKDMGGITYFEEDPNDEVPSIAAEVPNRENILNAIDTIKATVTSGDEVLFFFSGHGATIDDGIVDGDVEPDGDDEGIVVHDDGIANDTPSDTNSQLDFIWDGELRDLFTTGFATTRIAFVFDTCRAGGWNDVAGAGRIVSMATGENQSAYVYSTAGEDVDGDRIKDGEGVFSRYFVNEGMLQGLANIHDYIEVEGDEPATIEEAFDYAKDNIPPYLKRRQKPVISDQFTAEDNTKDLLL